MENKQPDLVTQLAGVSRQGRRKFYKQNKKELKMSWDQFNVVIGNKRNQLYGK
jgi:hypothetical protein